LSVARKPLGIASIQGPRGMPSLPPAVLLKKVFGATTTLQRRTLAMCLGSSQGLRPLHPWRGPSKGTKVFALVAMSAGRALEIPMALPSGNRRATSRWCSPGRKLKRCRSRTFGRLRPGAPGDTPVDSSPSRRIGAIMGSGGCRLDDTACMLISPLLPAIHAGQSAGNGRSAAWAPRACSTCPTAFDRESQRNDISSWSGPPNRSPPEPCGLGQNRSTRPTTCAIPRRVRTPPAGSLPRRQMHRPHQISHQRQLHRLYHLRPTLPCGRYPFAPYQRHTIDLDKCTRCDSCNKFAPPAP